MVMTTTKQTETETETEIRLHFECWYISLDICLERFGWHGL